MVTRSMEIKIPSGLEGRPVAHLVQVASSFQSRIYIECEEKKVNAKSIMGMMSLGLAEGESVTVSAEGEDEEQAVNGIEEYLSSK